MTNHIILAVFTLVGAWFTAFLGAYLAEKGKNSATRDDIAEITKKIEAVKDEFAKGLHRSTLYLDRRLQAYDKLAFKLSEIVHWRFMGIKKATPKQISDRMNKFGEELIQIYEEHEIYISEIVLHHQKELVRELGEFKASDGGSGTDDDWVKVLDALKIIKAAMRQEFFFD